MITLDRLMSHVEIDAAGCWLWTASLNNKGYSQVSVDGSIKSGHRVSYELIKGAIPDGLQIDHLCKVRRCVNPEHLEPVNQPTNMRRSFDDACRRGHPRTPENTKYVADGTRRCTICLANVKRRYLTRQRAS